MFVCMYVRVCVLIDMMTALRYVRVRVRGVRMGFILFCYLSLFFPHTHTHTHTHTFTHTHTQVVVQSCYAIHFLCFTQNNISWMGANGGVCVCV